MTQRADHPRRPTGIMAAEAARRIGVTTSGLNWLRVSGKVHATLRGAEYIYDPVDIEREAAERASTLRAKLSLLETRDRTGALGRDDLHTT